MKIADWGRLSGEVVVFGGPYSNRQAVEALRARTCDAAHHICTGDVVAYCADPCGTLEVVRTMGARVIAGNCERQLASGAADCGCGFEDGTACDLLSANWFGYASAAIDAQARAWMADLPDWAVFTHAARRYVVVHGAATDVARFIWGSTVDAEFKNEINIIEEEVGPVDVVISGHSGIGFEKQVGSHHWINAGVIGMPPHDGRAQTEYVRLSEQGAVSFHRLDYDAPAAAAQMRAAGLPEGYAQALTSGWWPSEDVLPAALRRTHSLARG